MKAELHFTPEDLQTLRGLIREELQLMKPREETYLTREEAAQLLKITLPTLHAWTAQGKIQKSKIGNRVLYSDEEIKRAILRMRE